jgi:uncharacterized membrane protein HdeD (DUF308 family)
MISLLRLLAKVYRTISWFTSGKHGNRGLTAFSGIMLVMLGLCLAGPKLGHALATIPAGLVVIVGLGLALRLLLWCWRRWR